MGAKYSKILVFLYACFPWSRPWVQALSVKIKTMQPTLLRLQREPAKRADLAYEALKGKLLSGLLSGGTRIDVNAFIEEIQTSRQPVLAAISRLAAEGFLRVVPQVGCWVSEVRPDEVADFFRFFALTEALACELAAERHDAVHLEALHGNLTATQRLLSSAADSALQAREFFRLNREFHGLIHAMARSAYVADHAGAMWDRCDFYLASADPHIQGERVLQSENEHEAIVKAIADGQARTAGALMAAHIQEFGAAAIQRLRARG
jgi:GntR family transcriptional regulator, rspAB operon transcriptional repressor